MSGMTEMPNLVFGLRHTLANGKRNDADRVVKEIVDHVQLPETRKIRIALELTEAELRDVYQGRRLNEDYYAFWHKVASGIWHGLKKKHGQDLTVEFVPIDNEHWKNISLDQKQKARANYERNAHMTRELDRFAKPNPKTQTLDDKLHATICGNWQVANMEDRLGHRKDDFLFISLVKNSRKAVKELINARIALLQQVTKCQT